MLLPRALRGASALRRKALQDKVSRLMDQCRDGGQWAQVCLVSYVDARVAKEARTPQAQMAPEAKRFRIVSTMMP